MTNDSYLNSSTVCVIGLGYTGLPLALGFAKHFKAIGMDIDKEKVKALTEKYAGSNLVITDHPEEIKKADFIIICVPTPIDENKQPNLNAVKGAAGIAGRNMKQGCTVILESTVYPGVTEDIVRPALEKESGFTCGQDFFIGYSPERINPGDNEHTVERVIKVVSGMNEEVTEVIADLYRKVTPRIFKAKNIKTAEASKVTENIQRDLNIALTNELAIIFEKLGLNSNDVFDAAGTKWNFHRYNPGMVGGPCIPVVPYYLVHKSKEVGYQPQVILAGLKVNDSMPGYIAEVTANALKNRKKTVKGANVLVMGLTYKENVPEARESPAKELVKELKKYGIDVYGYEMLLDEAIVKKEFNTEPVRELKELKNNKMDAVIITVPHASFLKLSLDDLKAVQSDPPVLIDIPGIFKNNNAEKAGFFYRAL
jgi:UDP-N-acetyl-D-glucosamine/UDP-N-acetyl-D-galactosamine dehydrogenase